MPSTVVNQAGPNGNDVTGAVAVGEVRISVLVNIDVIALVAVPDQGRESARRSVVDPGYYSH